MSLGHPLFLTATIVGCLAIPVTGWAQEQTEPPPGETAPASEEAPDKPAVAEAPLVVPEQPTDLAPLLVPPGPVHWVIRARLQEGWESNPLFEQEIAAVSPPKEGGDFVSHASLDIARRWVRPRSDTSLSVSGSGTLFAGNKSYNQGGVGATATWRWQPSRRVGTRADGSYGYGTRHQAMLADEGLLLPQVTTQTILGEGGLDLGLGRRTQGALDVRYRRVTFDSATMNDGDQIGASAQLTRQMGVESSLTGAYGYTRGSSRVASLPPRSSHVASLAWSGSLLPRLRAEGSIGVIYLPAWVDAEATTLPSGGVSLIAHWQSTRLEGGYRREAGEAFGYGFYRVADLFRLAWQQNLGRRVTWFNGGTYGISRNPGYTFKLQTISVSTTLSVIVGRSWFFGAGYNFRRRDQRSAEERPSVSSHTVSVSLRKEWQAR